MKKLAVAFALILASLALVACGSSSDDSSATSAETTTESQAETGQGQADEAEGGTAGSAATLDIEAGEGLAYTSDSATADAGKVTVNFTNPQPLTHDVAIEDSSGKTIGKTELIAEGSDSAAVDLKPGEYTFYCTVPGHREAGMEGTLSVK
jgi:plastocyanin